MVCPRCAGENTLFIHEGPRRKPLQDRYFVCARRAAENTFFGLTQIMVVDHQNHLRNSPILPAGVLVCHIVSSFLQMSTEPGKHPGQTHLNSDAKIADEGHPQGGGEGTHKGGEGTHKGGEGTHKGCPYLHFPAKKPASSRQRRMEFAIAHYDLHSSRRYPLRRAPTRGAHTRFRQPHVVLSQFDAIALGKHQGLVIDHFARFTQGRELTMAESSLFAYEAPCKRV